MKSFVAHVLAVSLLATIGTITSVARGASAAPVVTTPPAAFVPVQPCRLADTRPDGGNGYSRVDPQTISISTLNRCGIPTGSTALAVTLTVVDPAAEGFLTAWPGDHRLPTVSNLNFQADQTRANGTITKIDDLGRLRVYTSVPAFVVVDVVGAFVPQGATVAAGRFVPSTSSRLFDSRPNNIVAAGGSVTVPLPAGVPAGAIALALNITVTESTQPGFVTAFPAGTPMPTASALNLDWFDQTRAAGGIFGVSAQGITLFLSGGGHVVVDYSGYFTGPSASPSSDGLFSVVDPVRLMDTRQTSPLGVGVPIYPQGGVELPLSQRGSMAYNVTSVDGDAGFIRGYAAGTPQPDTSTLNPQGQGDIVANFAITQTSDHGLDFWSQPQTNLVVDLQGWFSGPSVTATIAAPTNRAPATPRATYSKCTHEGLDRINTERRRARVAALVVNPAAQATACAWALHLAQLAGGISHSVAAPRDAEVGCPTGENVAFSTAPPSIAVPQLMDLWMASPPHHANIVFRGYVGIGLGYVTRTDATGATRTYGSTTFAVC